MHIDRLVVHACVVKTEHTTIKLYWLVWCFTSNDVMVQLQNKIKAT